jgi:hypothetical protein
MGKILVPAFVAAVVSSFCLQTVPASAVPTTYVYSQTSASIPGFNVQGSILINGGLDDLPFIFQGSPQPYDFGNLLGFNLSLGGQNFGLADFSVPNMLGFPLWSIAPDQIRLVDKSDNSDFFIQGGTISFNTDNASSICSRSGNCVAFGNWVSTVPEPIPLSLFAIGTAGAFTMRRRKAKAA